MQSLPSPELVKQNGGFFGVWASGRVAATAVQLAAESVSRSAGAVAGIA